MGCRWDTASSNAWATSFISSLKARNSVKISRFIDLWERWDKTTRTPLFFCSFYFVLHLLHFFFFVICAGSHIPICEGLTGTPQIVSSVHSPTWVSLHVQSQVMVS